jgi:hypothetical protein
MNKDLSTLAIDPALVCAEPQCDYVPMPERVFCHLHVRHPLAKHLGDVSERARSEERAARRARRAADAAAAADAARLTGVTLKYGPDAVMTAYLKGLERADKGESIDPIEHAFCNARGAASDANRATVARARREGELKYAKYVGGAADPTGDAATSKGTDWWVLVADTFTFDQDGQNPIGFDAAALADAIGGTAESVTIEVAAALVNKSSHSLSRLVDDLSKRVGRRVGMGELHEAVNNHVAVWVK